MTTRKDYTATDNAKVVPLRPKKRQSKKEAKADPHDNFSPPQEATSVFQLEHTGKYLRNLGLTPHTPTSGIRIAEATGPSHRTRRERFVRFRWRQDPQSPRITDGVISVSYYGVEKEDRLEHKSRADQWRLVEMELKAFRFPISVLWPSLEWAIADIPDKFKSVQSQNIFPFYSDTEPGIIMLQLRIDLPDGEKAYIPLTKWQQPQRWINDLPEKTWVEVNHPEGEYPIYGIERLNTQRANVALHEGAKSAERVRALYEDGTSEVERDAFPWFEDLKGYVHLGWIGGAAQADMTDWTSINRKNIARAVIICDNDTSGVTAVKTIAHELKCETASVIFDKRWPDHFDLADPFPKNFYQDGIYVGPTFDEMVHDCTWQTDVSIVNGKEVITLRDHVNKDWFYIRDSEHFINRHTPNKLRTDKNVNNAYANVSDTRRLSNVILGLFGEFSDRVVYLPGRQTGFLNNDNAGGRVFNTWAGPGIVRSLGGDPQPWLDLINRVLPREEEAYQALRWAATLIAKPEVRMLWAWLLMSKETGVGKTTIGETLGYQVGLDNFSAPSESEIEGNYNSWIAHKKLVLVNEIYAGNSYAMANKLKPLITDKMIRVTEKYEKAYAIDNYMQLISLSNDQRALKIAHEDRRWFVPEVAETKWPRNERVRFYEWRDKGPGNGAIRQWAFDFGDYVETGEEAPVTPRKADLVRDSMTPSCVMAMRLAEAMNESEEGQEPRPLIVFSSDVYNYIVVKMKTRTVYESELELRNIMARYGCTCYKEQLYIKKRGNDYVIANKTAAKLLPTKGLKDARDLIVQFSTLVTIDSIMDERM